MFYVYPTMKAQRGYGILYDLHEPGSKKLDITLGWCIERLHCSALGSYNGSICKVGSRVESHRNEGRRNEGSRNERRRNEGNRNKSSRAGGSHNRMTIMRKWQPR